jgi:hypothetical protein
MGPGYGESVLVHVGDRFWTIVDSCKGAWSKEPAPLWYLRELGADLSEVIAVAATHWHDDHFFGISEIVNACPNAKVILSQALANNEFLTLVDVYSKTNLKDTGVKELYRVTEAVKGQGRVVWAKQDLTFLKYLGRTMSALSPSDKRFEDSVLAFSKLLPTTGKSPLRVGSPRENHTSLVIWVDADETKLLLGADLESTKHPDTGWTVILDKSIMREGQASFFKVPHHGSDNGHVERVWQEALTQDVVATLTPFKGGRTTLPKTADAKRIDSLAGASFITGPPRTKKAIRALPTGVKKTLKELGKQVREVPVAQGLIRARWKLGSDTKWRVETYGEAGRLKDVVKF